MVVHANQKLKELLDEKSLLFSERLETEGLPLNFSFDLHFNGSEVLALEFGRYLVSRGYSCWYDDKSMLVVMPRFGIPFFMSVGKQMFLFLGAFVGCLALFFLFISLLVNVF